MVWGMEKVIPYSRRWVTQNTGYYCGASVQTVILGKTGRVIPEDQLARDLRTTVNGTDYIGHFPAVLNSHIGGGWKHQDINGVDATSAETETLWQRLVSGVDNGFGMVANFVVPRRIIRARLPRPQSPQPMGVAWFITMLPAWGTAMIVTGGVCGSPTVVSRPMATGCRFGSSLAVSRVRATPMQR